MWKTIFKSILIAISYYTLKKFIERFPAPYRPYAVFALRASVFLVLSLVIFSFLSNHVNAIGKNMGGGSHPLTIVLAVFFFLVAILFSFLLTAFVEEIYRKISEVHQKVGGGIKKATDASGHMVKQSVETTKNLFTKAAQAFGALYETSTKATGSSVDKADELIQKALKRKE